MGLFLYMTTWPNNRSEFGQNRTPVLIGVSSADGQTVVPVAVDAATGAIITETSGSGSDAVNLIKVGGSAIALGSTTMSASIPVTLASNDTNTTPFVTSGGGGYIRQDSTATIAKESGGNLATIATNTSNSATSANQTNGAQQTKITDGTNIANVGTADSGNNFQFMGGVPKTDSISLSAGSQSSAWFDLAMYPSFSLEILTNASGNTLSFQTSSDAAQTNVTGTILMVSSTNNGAGVGSSSSATATLSGSRTGRYFRVSSTLSGGNTATLTLTRYTMPHFFPIVGGQVNATQSGTWTVGSNSATGSAIPANVFPMGIKDNNGNLAVINSAGDVADNNVGGTIPTSGSFDYNGIIGNWDRHRNNNTGALIAAGTTSTQSAVALTTYNARSLTLVINITVATVATLTVTVNGASSSSYTYTLGASSALASIATTTLMFGPGLPATTNASFNVPLPRNVQVTATVTGTCTYGIDYILSV